MEPLDQMKLLCCFDENGSVYRVKVEWFILWFLLDRIKVHDEEEEEYDEGIQIQIFECKTR